MENIGLALTNLFLGLCCILYAKYSWKTTPSIPLLKNNVTWLYLSIFLVSMISFLMFGFYNMPNGEIHNFIEQALLLSTSLVFYFIWVIILTLKMPTKPRKARALLLIPTFIYALFTFQWSTFTYTNLILLPSIGTLFFLIMNMYFFTKNKQLLFGTLALIMLTVLIFFQNYLINIETPFFFFLYTPLVALSSFIFYRGMALFLNRSSKTGLTHVITNNNLNFLTSSAMFQIFTPKTVEEIQAFIKQAKQKNKPLSCQSSGYSIGGQQLIENGILINTKKINQIDFFDSVNGLVKTAPSITWHQVLSYLNRAQKDNPNAWVPKQLSTHFLDYSIGGAVSSNTHGNNLFCLPLINNIESLDLIDIHGQVQRVNRTSNNELFKLAIGGYGLFGVITGVELRLSKKRILQRKVESIFVKDLQNEIDKYTQAGCLNFELVLNINELEYDFLQKGILSCYLPIETDPKTIQFESYHDSIFDKKTFKEHFSLMINNKQNKISIQNEFLYSKNESYYWSNNIVPYFPIEKNLRLINLLFPEYREHNLIKHEFYIPISQITSFLSKLSMHKICREFNLASAVITVTKKDEESYLHWSNRDYLALELSFYIKKSDQSLILIKEYLLEITELAILYQGSFSLGYTQTYKKSHLLKCYPQITDFLNLKLKHDPSELFQSNWYQAIKKIIYDSKIESPSFSSSHQDEAIKKTNF